MRAVKIFVAALLLLIFIQPACHGRDLSARDYFDRASYQYLVGNFEEALKNIDMALKLQPGHPGAQNLKNVILREKEITAGERSKSAENNLAAGKDHFERGEFSKAVVYFNQVLGQDPENKEASRLLGQSLAEIDKQKQSRYWYRLGALVSFAVGCLAALGLLSFIILSLRRAVARRSYYCFNCRAKISPNIDLCPNCGAWVGAKMRASISRQRKSWYGKVGWHKNPFTLDIHPELFTGYRNEVKQILEKVAGRSGHILVTGQLGAGKTTLLRWLANYLANGSLAIYIPRPPQEFNQIIKLIIENMRISTRHAVDYDIYHLSQLRKKIGKPLVILLDEAHEFTIEIEKPLRTLGDLDGVNLIMAGLPETVDKLKNEIRPLYERLVLEITLEKLKIDDIKELIRARVESAGGEGIHPFTPEAADRIYELSQGNPRSVVKICDWAVSRAIDQGEGQIGVDILKDLKLRE